ncbi:MAG: cytochrome c3 family protein [candidate division Zixibacteria bacterium]|nr:cytochrome c3 family protein [candidate division Zixibacteria bacterium]
MVSHANGRGARSARAALPSPAIWLFVWCLIGGVSGLAYAQDDVETCMSCHEDRELERENPVAGRRSVFVSLDGFQSSVHADMGCVDCHADLSGFDDYPHAEKLQPVNCGECHDDVTDIQEASIHGKGVAQCWNCHGHHEIVSPAESDVGEKGVSCNKCHQDIARQYDMSLHGQAVHAGAELAPRCWDCHGAHDVADVTSPEARVARFNIPFMCGECHKEGTPVTQRYNIPEDSILAHYSQSIHGRGLFQQGLLVTAVCADCHTAHNVRDHTDPESSIHRNNVAGTCKKCHGQIEQVHKKVIRGELWQKSPEKVPACVDCHSPHEIRRVFYEEGMSDKECLACHSNRNLSLIRDGQTVSLFVDTLEAHGSAHRGVTCAQCHTGATPGHDRPCETVVNRVDCSICHSDVVITYASSTHGQLEERGDPDAPRCVTCHGTHGVLEKRNSKSPTYPANVPRLCAQCHQSDAPAAVRRANEEESAPREIVDEYSMSIHGKGLLESGLVVTAMCTDCHTAHHVLPRDNSASSIHDDNIAATCATCHNGIYEQFQESIHSPLVSESEEQLPTCEDCHKSHTISRADEHDFRSMVMLQCGSCHEDLTKSYFETFHGKVSNLGSDAAAHCYDCHGAHDILPPGDPHSHLSRQNIVKTCGKCHEGSHRQFAGYLTHATHHDRTKYPILFYTFWSMTILLVGTLIVAGTHTLLWLPRSFQAMRQHKKLREEVAGNLEYRRFKPLHSRLHIMVVVSFLGLAVTGMTLKFSYLGWAQWLSGMLGGADSAAFIHRVCAIITFTYFGIHIFDVIREKRRQGKTWKQTLLNPNSMLPNKTDISEAWGTLKWFIGLGARPRYGRWTYWEKFDYFAVFWGVAVIGLTGLMLWFPETFTRFLPGWIINVATIVHSDEALLASAFIFTVHFFNTHFRPDKFPMDTVIFTGRVPLEELKEDRPREYEELVKSGELKKHLVEPLPPAAVRTARIFGTIALLIGLSIIILVIYAEVFGYR